MNWGNISSIVEETLQPSKFAMFKFENVYDYYLTEPTSIILNLAGEDKRSFEPIIRVEEKGKTTFRGDFILKKEKIYVNLFCAR